jgi:Xaa-Pro dipeptidase
MGRTFRRGGHPQTGRCLAASATGRSRCAILGEPQSALGAYVPNNPPEVLAYLEYERAFKTPYEIQMMREATRVGTRAHRAAEAAFRAGASEFDIHIAYCSAARQDAAELPYGNIVALNRHGAVLHYMDFDRAPPPQLHSFLIDAGASHAGYACDITRTYSANPGDEFQALVDAVDSAQRKCAARCAPVSTTGNCTSTRTSRSPRSCAMPASSPCRRKRRSATGVSSVFFPHGIGHGIGLQVHEWRDSQNPTVGA